MSVCPLRTTGIPLDGFSWKLIFEDLSNCRGKFTIHYNVAGIIGSLYEDLCAFVIQLAEFFRLRNVWTKFVD
jgi:hypothetical protein